jgi:hypothetical protein
MLTKVLVMLKASSTRFIFNKHSTFFKLMPLFCVPKSRDSVSIKIKAFAYDPLAMYPSSSARRLLTAMMAWRSWTTAAFFGSVSYPAFSTTKASSSLPRLLRAEALRR